MQDIAGYTFSAKGAALTVSLGQRPREHGAQNKASAESAIHVQKPVRFWSREVIHRVGARLQRLVMDGKSHPGAMPQARIWKSRRWR